MTDNDTNNGLTIAGFVSICVALLGVCGKIINKKIKSSECFGVKMEMENTNATIAQLQNEIKDLKNKEQPQVAAEPNQVLEV